MLQIGYFNEFKEQKTLLLAGSQVDIMTLQQFFRSWFGATIELVEYLGRATSIHVIGLAKLVLQREGEDSRAERCHNQVIWRISSEWQVRIVGLLEGLCKSENPSHQYLDSGGEGIQIICSKDEYPALLVD